MGTSGSERESSISNEEIQGDAIPHPVEHVHQLVLTDQVRDYHGILCSRCNIPVRSGWSYACIPCKFGVHKNCEGVVESRPSIWLPNSKNFSKTKVIIAGLKSQELLINQGQKYEICLRCGEKCTGTITRNTSKGFGCHESCSLLPSEIQHPFHPHKLVLGFPPTPPHQSSCCYACRCKNRQFSKNQVCQIYHCTLCSHFYIHIQCAQQMPVLKHWSHPQHPLVLFRMSQEAAHRYNDIKCNWCGHGWPPPHVRSCFGVYRCVPCNFSIHETCIKYHKIIDNHDEHHHPLHYISPNKEAEVKVEAEVEEPHEYEWSPLDYCEVCGDSIIQNYPIYKCFQCPNEFLFHGYCALTPSQEEVSEDADDSLVHFQELCESFAKEKCNAPFPALLLLEERISESAGNVECLTLELEEDIRRLTALKLVRKDLENS